MKLLVVFCVVVALVLGSPLPPNTRQCASCTEQARLLLNNLSHVMEKEGKMKHLDLFAGFNCTDQSTQMNPFTQTATVCQPTTPANMSCSNQRNLSFSVLECLWSIRADLRYYNHLLNSYINRVKQTEDDLSPLLMATINLKNCVQHSCPLLSAERMMPEWVIWTGSSFDDRLSLCKALKGFHLRVVTINRMLGYIASDDYQK